MTWRRELRRFVLRAVGLQAWETAVLLEDRRWSIDVTPHAIQRAGERYGCPDPLVILADVALALRWGRRGPTSPNGYTAHGRKIACVWTEDEAREYVVRRRFNRWIVVTSLPCEKKTRSARARIRAERRRNIAPLPVLRPANHDLHPHGAPTVEQAFHTALTRKSRATA